jgi:hypothetical protein
VLCGDGSRRFLVFAAADVREEAIELRSALVLLEDVDFYRQRSRSLRDLLSGDLCDLSVMPDGSVEEVMLKEDERVESESVSAA